MLFIFLLLNMLTLQSVTINNSSVQFVVFSGELFFKVKDIAIAMGVSYYNFRYKVPEVYVQQFHVNQPGKKPMFCSAHGVLTTVKNDMKKKECIMQFTEEFQKFVEEQTTEDNQNNGNNYEEYKKPQILVKQLMEKYKNILETNQKLVNENKKLKEDNQEMKNQLENDSMIQELEELLKN